MDRQIFTVEREKSLGFIVCLVERLVVSLPYLIIIIIPFVHYHKYHRTFSLLWNLWTRIMTHTTFSRSFQFRRLCHREPQTLFSRLRFKVFPSEHGNVRCINQWSSVQNSAILRIPGIRACFSNDQSHLDPSHPIYLTKKPLPISPFWQSLSSSHILLLLQEGWEAVSDEDVLSSHWLFLSFDHDPIFVLCEPLFPRPEHKQNENICSCCWLLSFPFSWKKEGSRRGKEKTK